MEKTGFIIITILSIAFISCAIKTASYIPEYTVMGNNKTTEIVVSSCGKTHDEAVDNGKRMAIQKVSGVYLSSDSAVENYSLIKDKISTYSKGFIKSFKVLKEDKKENADCLISEAIVEDEALLNSMTSYEALNPLMLAYKHEKTIKIEPLKTNIDVNLHIQSHELDNKQENEYYVVNVIGVGKNQKEALDSAIREALEYVEGVFGKSTTVIKDGDLSDEINVKTAGYIKNYDITKEEALGEDIRLFVTVNIDRKLVDNSNTKQSRNKLAANDIYDQIKKHQTMLLDLRVAHERKVTEQHDKIRKLEENIEFKKKVIKDQIENERKTIEEKIENASQIVKSLFDITNKNYYLQKAYGFHLAETKIDKIKENEINGHFRILITLNNPFWEYGFRILKEIESYKDQLKTLDNIKERLFDTKTPNSITEQEYTGWYYIMHEKKPVDKEPVNNFFTRFYFYQKHALNNTIVAQAKVKDHGWEKIITMPIATFVYVISVPFTTLKALSIAGEGKEFGARNSEIYGLLYLEKISEIKKKYGSYLYYINTFGEDITYVVEDRKIKVPLAIKNVIKNEIGVNIGVKVGEETFSTPITIHKNLIEASNGWISGKELYVEVPFTINDPIYLKYVSNNNIRIMPE